MFPQCGSVTSVPPPPPAPSSPQTASGALATCCSSRASFYHQQQQDEEEQGSPHNHHHHQLHHLQYHNGHSHSRQAEHHYHQRRRRGSVVPATSSAVTLYSSADEMDSASDDQSSSCSSRHADCRTLVQEARAECDHIRLAAYRCAAKLRHIQKRTSLHQVDIWHVIEALREHGISSPEQAETRLHVGRLDALLTALCLALNKRLPLQRQVNLDAVVNTLLNLVMTVYGTDGTGYVDVFSVKVALSTLCSGKLVDKLRYMFSQLSDTHGHLSVTHFGEYLRQVLLLAAIVGETGSFHCHDQTARHIFPAGPVDVDLFLKTLLMDPGVECLLWMSVLDRMTHSETVFHDVQCGGCESAGFSGFKYRCRVCLNYQLCQNCFWRGQTSGAHTLQHAMQEIGAPNAPVFSATNIRSASRCNTAFRKSTSTIAGDDNVTSQHDVIECVTSAPTVPHGIGDARKSTGVSSMYALTAATLAPPRSVVAGSVSSGESVESERSISHSLLARRTINAACQGSQKLSHEDEHCPSLTRYPAYLPSAFIQAGDSDVTMRDVIASHLDVSDNQLQMTRLRAGAVAGSLTGVDLVSELHALHCRRGQLECQLSNLHSSRRHLMQQLDSIMTLLKSQRVCDAADAPVVCGMSKSAPSTPGSTLRRSRVGTTVPALFAGGVVSCSTGQTTAVTDDSGLDDAFNLNSPEWLDTAHWQPRS